MTLDHGQNSKLVHGIYFLLQSYRPYLGILTHMSLGEGEKWIRINLGAIPVVKHRYVVPWFFHCF